MIEEWKRIDVWGDYEISNYGRFLNLETGKIITGTIGHDGYKTIRLYKRVGKEKKMKDFTVHILVAKVFVKNDNPDVKTVVNHIDENKLNAISSNLEWVTQKSNCNHGTRNEKIGCGGHPVNEYTLDGRYIRTWKNMACVSKVYNVSSRTIWDAVNGKVKVCYGRLWRRYDNILTSDIPPVNIQDYIRSDINGKVEKGIYKYDVEIDDNLLYKQIDENEMIAILEDIINNSNLSKRKKKELEVVYKYIKEKV